MASPSIPEAKPTLSVMKTKVFTFGELEIRFNWAVSFFILLVLFGLIRLGIWQLDRAQEKMSLQDTYLEMGTDQPVPVDDVPMSGLENDALNIQNLHVSASGEYMNDKTIFLIYQTHEDNIGYEVITPFKLDEADKIVFVSRGWILANTYEETKDKVQPILGKQTIQGQVFVPTLKQADRTNDIDLSDVQWPLELRYLNMLEISHLFEETYFPYEVRLDEGQAGVLIRHWPTVMVDTSRNFSYSLQWFAMSIALLIVTFILSSNILQLIQKRSKPI